VVFDPKHMKIEMSLFKECDRRGLFGNVHDPVVRRLRFICALILTMLLAGD
jgi:hypothetical protein